MPVSFATFWRFQSTLPGWGATVQHRLTGFILKISIHAPRMGSDCLRLHNCSCHMKFQSTLPGWGATVCSRRIGCRCRDFNPRSPDGERHTIRIQRKRNIYISIHAPRMGSDYPVPHPCALHPIFQSTLPGWGATSCTVGVNENAINFNPRSPDGERLTCATHKTHSLPISIHAPRMGSDCPD